MRELGRREGTAARCGLCWADLGRMWVQTLGTRTLALPILQEQARALQAEAGMSLVPALCPGCSLGIAMDGGQQGFQGTANNQVTLAERNERLGGERNERLRGETWLEPSH